jgi:hypothetical protein
MAEAYGERGVAGKPAVIIQDIEELAPSHDG